MPVCVFACTERRMRKQKGERGGLRVTHGSCGSMYMYVYVYVCVCVCVSAGRSHRHVQTKPDLKSVDRTGSE